MMHPDDIDRIRDAQANAFRLAASHADAGKFTARIMGLPIAAVEAWAMMGDWLRARAEEAEREGNHPEP